MSFDATALQRALAAHEPAYDPGPIDGVFGLKTQAAMQAFEEANDLPVTEKPVAAVYIALGIQVPDFAPPAPPKPHPNPLDNPLVRLGLQVLISRLFPGKDFPVGTIITTIESAWGSKINWTQVVGVIASVAVYFGIPIGDGEKAAIIGVIQGLQSLVTWYLRTYRTTSVTPASAAKIAAK